MIRMAEFSGTDWGSEGVASADLNDTFAACYQNFMRFIGQDTTGATLDNSTTETVLNQVSVPANTVTNYLIVMGYARFRQDANGVSCTIKIRIGTAGTTADAQTGNDTQISLDVVSGQHTRQVFIAVVAIAGTNFDKTAANYVSLTGDMSVANSGTEVTGESLLVFGM